MTMVDVPVNTDSATEAVRALAPLLDASVESSSDSTSGLVQRVLALARVHLGLEVSYFSRFEDGMQVFEDVSGDSAPFYVAPGLRTPLEVTYCSRVLAGELPNIIPDTRADPRTSDLPVTQFAGIGAYAGVPVTLPDGEVYGMLCCIGSEAHNEIDAGDVRFMRVLADLLSEEVLRRRPLDEERAAIGARIDHAISGGGLRMVYQPIVRLDSLEMIGVEALSRFDGGPPTPDLWFHEAAGIGRGVELISFSSEIDASLVAEGVETQRERETLLNLGATLGQGYLFARPGSLPRQPAVMSTTATTADATPTI